MVVTQTWRTCRRPEFSAGFTIAVRRLGFRMRKYPACTKPRPITSGEEVTDQLYESDNDDRDQRRACKGRRSGPEELWLCGQKKSNRSNQAAIMKDRSGVASIGAALVAIEAAFSPRLALFASLAPVCAADGPVAHFCRGCGAAVTGSQLRLTEDFWGLTAHGLFILQCSNYLFWVELENPLANGAAGVPRQQYRIPASSAKA